MLTEKNTLSFEKCLMVNGGAAAKSKSPVKGSMLSGGFDANSNKDVTAHIDYIMPSGSNASIYGTHNIDDKSHSVGVKFTYVFPG